MRASSAAALSLRWWMAGTARKAACMRRRWAGVRGFFRCEPEDEGAISPNPINWSTEDRRNPWRNQGVFELVYHFLPFSAAAVA